MPRTQGIRNVAITIHDDVFLRATRLPQIGRVVVVPCLGVHGAVGAVGSAVDELVVDVEEVLWGVGGWELVVKKKFKKRR